MSYPTYDCLYLVGGDVSGTVHVERHRIWREGGEVAKKGGEV